MKDNNQSEKFSSEDEKNIRKYRKYLRQIEHLQMLARPLNADEKMKLSKKSYYREQLDSLKALYGTADLSISNRNCNLSDESKESIEHKDAEGEPEAVEENESEEEAEEAQEAEEDEEESKYFEEVNDEREGCQEDLANYENSNDIKQSSKEDLNVVQEKVEEVKPKKKKSKLKTNFRRKNFKSIHDDLILCLDVYPKLNLIVTGSRDTTIRVWEIDEDKNIKLIQSYGGHSSSITCVKFWSYDDFMSYIERLAESENEKVNVADQENARNILNEFRDVDHRNPFILSSSLDCSIRIWCLEKAMCVKEMYLYNPVNHFSVSGSSFGVGMIAGKVEYWKNGQKKFSTRAYEDTESVCHVKLLEKNGAARLYTLTQNGLLKIFDLIESDEKNTDFRVIHGSYVLDNLPDNTNLYRLTFKSFEILNEDKLILICNHQSFVILYDVIEESSKLISTNSNRYGITNCISKCEDKIFMNAYDIDDSYSTINVFQVLSKESTDVFKYKYTLPSDLNVKNDCISTLTCKKSNQISDNEVDYIIASSSSKDLNLWFVENRYNNTSKTLKMKPVLVERSFTQMNQNDFTFNDEEETDDDSVESEVDHDQEVNNESNEANNKKDDSDEQEMKESKSYCLIQ